MQINNSKTTSKTREECLSPHIKHARSSGTDETCALYAKVFFKSMQEFTPSQTISSMSLPIKVNLSNLNLIGALFQANCKKQRETQKANFEKEIKRERAMQDRLRAWDKLEERFVSFIQELQNNHSD